MSGIVVCAKAEVAATFLARLLGLLGRAGLSGGCGLWLNPSSGVHTFGMRFPIDVIALASDGNVVSLHRDVRPWRIVAVGRQTRSVVELPAGALDGIALAVGDTVEITAVTTVHAAGSAARAMPAFGR